MAIKLVSCCLLRCSRLGLRCGRCLYEGGDGEVEGQRKKRDYALHGSLLVDFLVRGIAGLKANCDHSAASIAEMQGEP